MAALPSPTELSRASLLGGALGRGDQGYKRAHFGAHPALARAFRGSRPRRLFHKADLGSGPELDRAVRDALADPGCRVVGIVHNAVDAQLSGSEQIELAWSAEGMRQVTAILRVARDAGRVLVMTGDRGHVVDEVTTRAAPGAGGRWRMTGPAGDGGASRWFLHRVGDASGGLAPGACCPRPSAGQPSESSQDLCLHAVSPNEQM